MCDDRGIRCCYHGWLFDIDGTVLEIPGQPVGSVEIIKKKATLGAYPVREYLGLIFAYLGPIEDMPEFPGGDLALRKWIATHVKYPVIAQENGIQGKVYITFVVG